MPRDASGNYTLPLGNPVVDGTIIDVEWANPTMADIAVQLNNVITRDGVLGFTSPLKIVDGTVTNPGLAFSSETGLGLFRPSAGVLAVASGGIERGRFSVNGFDTPKLGVVGAASVGGILTAGSITTPGTLTVGGTSSLKAVNAVGNMSVTGNITATGNITGADITATGNLTVGGALGLVSLTVSGRALFADGTAPLPSLSFFNDSNSGFYRSGPDQISVALGGVQQAAFTPTALNLLNGLGVGGSIDVNGNVSVDGTITAGSLSTTGSFSAVNFTASGKYMAAVGSAGAPAYTFTADQLTGMYRSGGDAIGFVTAGVLRMNIQPTITEIFGELRANAFLTNSDPGLGIYISGGEKRIGLGNGNYATQSSNNLAFVLGGSTKVQMDGAGDFRVFVGNGLKPGGGSWADVSDEQFKDGITNFNRGMALIRQLNPKRYHFKAETGRDPSKVYIGLIAQAVETRFPEAVTPVLTADVFPGYTGPVVETRLLNTNFLIYTVINALQEFDSRIALLENA